MKEIPLLWSVNSYLAPYGGLCAPHRVTPLRVNGVRRYLFTPAPSAPGQSQLETLGNFLMASIALTAGPLAPSTRLVAGPSCRQVAAD